jgi:hypothetical protein
MKTKLALITLLGVLASSAQASTIVLDFETGPTGGDFAASNTLSTALGNITFNDFGSGCSLQPGFEIPTTVLCFNDGGGFDTLTFDFDVDFISGATEYRGGGQVAIDALDLGGSVIASFLTSNPVGFFSFNPLSAIRSLRISDPLLNFSGIDNLTISSSAGVPIPGTLGLLAMGLASTFVSRRRQSV